MAYVRKKKIKGNTYYYLVEGYVDEHRKLHQRNLRYLGSVKNIEEKFKFWDDNH